MVHENQSIPEFMTKYYQDSDHHGKEDIAALAKEYEAERATFLQTVFVQKQLFQRDWIKLTGKGKLLTVDEALVPMNLKYEQKAQEVVEKNQTKFNVDRIEMAREQSPAQTQPKAPDVQPEDERQKMLKQLKKLHAENARMTQRQRP